LAIFVLDNVLSLFPGFEPFEFILDPNSLEPRLLPSGIDCRNVTKAEAVYHRRFRN